MTKEEIIRYRLACQQITQACFSRPEDLVAWMGCIQAQDYAGAKWAIGCRLGMREGADGKEPAGPGELKAVTDAAIEQAYNEGRILRTHILRPTWHFVNPADIRWMLALTAKRIKAFAATHRRQMGLDVETFKRSNAALKKALKGGKKLTRKELEPVFKKLGIRSDDNQVSHLLMEAEVDGILCSGGMKGKQFTYTLLDEWAPEERFPTPKYTREEAVAELTLRYFRSRGPAQLADFAWWSGLTIGDAKLGVEANRSQYVQFELDGKTYWCHRDCTGTTGAVAATGIFALPPFDEYTVAYTDRTLVVKPEHGLWTSNGILKPSIVRDGEVVGVWQRAVGKKEVTIGTGLFKKVAIKPLKAAFERYGAFVGKKLELT